MFCESFVIECGDFESRVAVIALHKVGKSASDISATLKKLKINRIFVYRTISRYIETGTIKDCLREGRPRSMRTDKVDEAVAAHIQRNPVRRQ